MSDVMSTEIFKITSKILISQQSSLWQEFSKTAIEIVSWQLTEKDFRIVFKSERNIFGITQ